MSRAVAAACVVCLSAFAGFLPAGTARAETIYWTGDRASSSGVTTGLFSISGNWAFSSNGSWINYTRTATLNRYYETYAAATGGGYAQLDHAPKIYHRATCSQSFPFEGMNYMECART